MTFRLSIFDLELRKLREVDTMFFKVDRRLKLWVAAQSGSLDEVQRILASRTYLWSDPVDINWCNPAEGHNSSAIYVACQGGFSEIVTCLFDNGAEFNFPASEQALSGDFTEENQESVRHLSEIYPKLSGDAAGKLAAYLFEIYYSNLKNYPEAAKWSHYLFTDHRQYYLKEVLEQRVKAVPEFAYERSKFFSNEKQLLCLYCAALNNHHAARIELKAFADDSVLHAQYLYGKLLLSCYKLTEEGLHYFFKAIVQQYDKALTYLASAQFKWPVLIEIAKYYHQGRDGVAASKDQAIYYYHRAEQAGAEVAVLYLGQLYEKHYRLGVAEDARLACQYYLSALKKGYTGALPSLEELLEKHSYPDLDYELARLYETLLHDTIGSLKWYKRLADRRHLDSSARLKVLVSENPDIAYALAKRYEADVFSTVSDEKALFCYAFAAEKGHVEGKAALLTRADSGGASAQYVLGYRYYHKIGDLKKAVSWCMRAAAQGHQLSIQYLENQSFSSDILYFIARTYEKGEIVPKNIARAIQFYVKASRKNHAKSLLRLADIQQMDYPRVQLDRKDTLGCYAQLSQLGCQQTVAMMQHLAEEGDQAARASLSQHHRSRGDTYHANFWQKRSRSRAIRPEKIAAQKAAAPSHF